MVLVSRASPSSSEGTGPRDYTLMAWRGVLYDRIFSRYLLLTNTIVSCVLDGLGDYIEQRIERNETQDWQRTKRMAIMGLFFGPLDHYWYKLLDKRLPGATVQIALKKVIIDEAVLGMSTTAIFFEGKPHL